MTDAKTIIEQLLERRTPATFRAGGPSMNPTIRDGESVRIRPLREPGSSVDSSTHRLLQLQCKPRAAQ